MVVGIVGKDFGLDAGGLLHAVILENRRDLWVDALKLVPCLVLGPLFQALNDLRKGLALRVLI